MATTKADILAFIATIDDGGLNTALEVRTLLTNMLNDNYPTTLIQENSLMVGTVTAKNTINTNLAYSVSILKQGKYVVMSGFVQNNSSSIVSSSLSNDFFFEIIDPVFFPELTAPFIQFPVYNANFATLSDTDLKRFYINSVGAGQIKTFNIFYFIQN